MERTGRGTPSALAFQSGARRRAAWNWPKDTLSADSAYRLACAARPCCGAAIFKRPADALQALQRRTEAKPPKAAARAAAKIAASTPEEVFHLHRQAQSQRSRTLSALVIQVEGDYSIPLRRAPTGKKRWPKPGAPPRRGAGGVIARAAGRGRRARMAQKGVEIAALGDAPANRIHPHYGVFSPVRGEYIDLAAENAAAFPGAGV